MSSVRMLMQLAVQNNMITHQMDVKTAYNAPIDCEIYMEQPEGFEKRGENGEKLVCKLNKSLYGLKQSGRNRNNMLHNYLISQNFSQSLADPCGTEKVRDEEIHKLSDPRLYRAIFVSLIYVMTGTRPYLCYAVIKLSQNMSNPSQSDLIMAKER